MLSPLRSHFLSLPKQHHPLGIRHSNLWHLSFNPPQFYLDRFCLVSFKNLLLLTHTVSKSLLVQGTVANFIVFITGNITAFFYFYSGNIDFYYWEQSICWKEWSNFKSAYLIPLMVLQLTPQSWETIPTFYDFAQDSPSPMVFIQPMKPATTPPLPRSLPWTLLCWQGSLFALSHYLVQDSVACVHCPSS